jgi:hypothetical protein
MTNTISIVLPSNNYISVLEYLNGQCSTAHCLLLIVIVPSSVIYLGKKSMIIGHNWLHNHHPEVNWQTKEVKMSHCPVQHSICHIKNKDNLMFSDLFGSARRMFGESFKECKFYRGWGL